MFYRFCDASLTNANDGWSGTTPCTLSWPAKVSSFRLDKYEVTVGRFRAFVEGYDAWRAAGHPAAGEGGDPNVKSVETSWDAAWTANLPVSAAEFTDGASPLFCDPNWQTWVATPAVASETRAINCVSWFEAAAFCLWDGGWLPTEAEWMYAASGGQENRVFPWSNPASSTAGDTTYANYDNNNTGAAAVGSYDAGKGRWGHHDLGGNVWEWTWDAYADPYPGSAGTTCSNCVRSGSASAARVMRGGGFYVNDINNLRAAYRNNNNSPTYRDFHLGFRCAR